MKPYLYERHKQPREHPRDQFVDQVFNHLYLRLIKGLQAYASRLHILLSTTVGLLYTALTKQLNASCKCTGPQRSAGGHHQ
eukprot:874786-Pelagomonas_calceolata.AAC.1